MFDDYPSNDQNYSLAEELANVITHGLGALLALIGLVVLVAEAALSRSAWDVAALAIYGTTLVLAYLTSALYHGTRHGWRKRLFKVFDHCAIFLLIAGTYTPYLLLVVGDKGGTEMLTVIWILSLAGVALKIYTVHRFEYLCVAFYVVLGWIGIAGVDPLIERLPTAGFEWLVAGGVAYTAGVLFYLWERLPFNHAVWHLFVLAGSTCHFISIFYYVLPPLT